MRAAADLGRVKRRDADFRRDLGLGLVSGRWDTPIHVDAASGGFIAPFIYPELEWDFRLPLVKSINVSGHKYGLVYAGVGWVIWRSKEDLPEDLIFHINYLGADQPTFTLNFSKGLLLHPALFPPVHTPQSGYCAHGAHHDFRFQPSHRAVLPADPPWL